MQREERGAAAGGTHGGAHRGRAAPRDLGARRRWRRPGRCSSPTPSPPPSSLPGSAPPRSPRPSTARPSCSSPTPRASTTGARGPARPPFSSASSWWPRWPRRPPSASSTSSSTGRSGATPSPPRWRSPGPSSSCPATPSSASSAAGPRACCSWVGDRSPRSSRRASATGRLTRSSAPRRGSRPRPTPSPSFCRARGVDEIVLPADAAELAPVLLPALHCLPLGCRIRSEADFHEDLWSSVPVEHVGPDWMLSRGLDTSNHVAEGVKRLTDVVLALLILVALAPFTLLALRRDRPLRRRAALLPPGARGTVRTDVPDLEAAHDAGGRGGGGSAVGERRRPAPHGGGPAAAAHAPRRGPAGGEHPPGRDVLRRAEAGAAGVRRGAGGACSPTTPGATSSAPA